MNTVDMATTMAYVMFPNAIPQDRREQDLVMRNIFALRDLIEARIMAQTED